MARTIESIQELINKEVEAKWQGLSKSKTAEWRSWTFIIAAAIHAFELILDLFRKEVDTLTNKITPGTLRWYAEMCKRFQNGDTLEYDNNTALLYYPEKKEEKQIIKVASVSEGKDDKGDPCLFIKVAKYKDNDSKEYGELDDNEMANFRSYMDAVKFAGCNTQIVSTYADLLYYRMKVYHDPSIPSDTIRTEVLQALKDFKDRIDFDGVVYRQKLIDAVMDVSGVTTCVLESLQQCSYQTKDRQDWKDVDTHTALDAGYFNWSEEKDKKCELQVLTVNELLNPTPAKPQEPEEPGGPEPENPEPENPEPGETEEPGETAPPEETGQLETPSEESPNE
ncbi:MAG: hypothetical protein NC357_08220 [Bacteroides sp.]|nr:hypothetical protein [Bacteroides sp.]